MEYTGRVGAAQSEEDYEACIGLLECATITTGIVVTDALIKQSPVDVLWARTVSPGHWLTLFTGDVEEVRAAMERGVETAGDDLADDLFIANLHGEVPRAIRGPRPGLDVDALGIVEYRHAASTIVGADVAIKTAAVELIEIRLAQHLGGKGFFLVTGATADVEDAVAAAAAVGRERGTLIRDAVIARVDEDLLPHLLA